MSIQEAPGKSFEVGIMEPGARVRRERVAELLSRGQLQPLPTPASPDLDTLKLRLRTVREITRDNLLPLADELGANLARSSPHIKLHSARDGVEASGFLSDIAGGLKVISTNNSAVISREIRHTLLASGFNVVNSYLNEFDAKAKAFHDYWDLPGLLESGLPGAFSFHTELDGLLEDSLNPPAETKPYLALLGVNAISSDGTVVFLQHMNNILKDIQQADKVVVVAALEKITPGREDAAFISECMGIFGMESLLLGIEPRAPQNTVADLPSLTGATHREFHILLLDNGRSRLPGTPYQDLLLCIGCRACNRHCPIRHAFSNDDYLWTPRNYLAEYMDRKSPSVDTCLHCEACRVHCPLDIDLPALMWRAKDDPAYRHHRSFSHRLLGSPEQLARAGSFFAPAANLALGLKPVRQLMERVVGLDRRTHLPAFHRETFRGSFREEGR